MVTARADDVPACVHCSDVDELVTTVHHGIKLILVVPPVSFVVNSTPSFHGPAH